MRWHDTDRPSQENGPARNDMETRMTRVDTELPSTLSKHGPSRCLHWSAPSGQGMARHRSAKAKTRHGMTWRGRPKSMTRHDTEQEQHGAHMTWHGPTRSSICPRHGTAWHGVYERGITRQDTARHGAMPAIVILFHFGLVTSRFGAGTFILCCGGNRKEKCQKLQNLLWVLGYS